MVLSGSSWASSSIYPVLQSFRLLLFVKFPGLFVLHRVAPIHISITVQNQSMQNAHE